MLTAKLQEDDRDCMLTSRIRLIAKAAVRIISPNKARKLIPLQATTRDHLVVLDRNEGGRSRQRGVAREK